MANMDLSWFDNFMEAYHHLIKDLIDLQVEKIWLVLNGENVKKYFQTGFVENSIFINILTEKLTDFEIITSEMPFGSAIGATFSVR